VANLESMPTTTITYAVADILQRIESKLDHVSSRLESKAESSEVALVADRIHTIEIEGTIHSKQIASEVRDIEQRLREVEKTSTSLQAVDGALFRAKAAMYSALGAVIAAVTALILYLHK